MIDFLRHLLGFCGEYWHPNIFHVLIGGSSISYAIFRIKNALSFRKGKYNEKQTPS